MKKIPLRVMIKNSFRPNHFRGHHVQSRVPPRMEGVVKNVGTKTKKKAKKMRVA